MNSLLKDFITTQVPEPNLAKEQNPLLLFLAELEEAFNAPKVVSISVLGDTSPIVDDSPVTYTANVVAVGGASTAVTWSVDITSGAAGTTINASTGALTFSAPGTVEVTATSVFDGDVSGTLTVTIAPD